MVSNFLVDVVISLCVVDVEFMSYFVLPKYTHEENTHRERMGEGKRTGETTRFWLNL